MNGIYGILFSNNQVNNVCEHFYNEGLTCNEFVIDSSIVLGHISLKKFTEDRFFYENEKYICCFEGINYTLNKSPEFFIQEILHNKIGFLKNLKGLFAGFLFDKSKNDIVLFNDGLSTKNIYYYYDSKIGLVFSSRLNILSYILRKNNVKIDYNIDSVYCLAVFGQLFNQATILKNVHKLEYGSCLVFDFDTKKMGIESFYKLEKKTNSNISFNNAIHDFNDIIETAIRHEWSKDEEYGYNHIALISGGMDSRVNAMIAKKLGYKNITTYSYGDPNSSDMKIGSLISKNEFYSHLSHNINNGEYLVKNILDNYIKLSDGMALYTPSATMKFSLEKLDFSHYGVLHSGQIGDVVFGSFIKPDFNFEKNKGKIGLTGFVVSNDIMEKINSLSIIVDKYNHSDYELYAYEQRQINGTLTGDRVASHFVDHVSPYYDTELIQFLLSLPNEFKLNNKFYFAWLKKYHPEILEYKWEKINMMPNHFLKVKYGTIYKKYYNGYKKYFNLKYDSMNPISNWVADSANIKNILDSIFKEEITKIKEPYLIKDLTTIYSHDIFEYRNKFAVITALLSIKLHCSNL